MNDAFIIWTFQVYIDNIRLFVWLQRDETQRLDGVQSTEFILSSSKSVLKIHQSSVSPSHVQLRESRVQPKVKVLICQIQGSNFISWEGPRRCVKLTQIKILKRFLIWIEGLKLHQSNRERLSEVPTRPNFLVNF